MSFLKSNQNASSGAPKPLPRHARTESLRKRFGAPLASFAVVAAVISALLVGFGGQHPVKSASGHQPGPSSEVIPLPGPTTTSTPATVPSSIVPTTEPPPSIPTTEPRVTVTTYRQAVAPRRTRPATASVTPTTTVTTHPTPTTTVTTVVSHPAAGTTVTSVTTITAHPTAGTPVTSLPSTATTTVTTVRVPATTTTEESRPATTTTVAPRPATTTTVTPHPATTTTVAPHPATTTTVAPPATTTVPPPPPTTTTTPTASSSAPVSFQEGAYVGGAGPAGVTAFAAATRSKITVGSDYLPGGNGWAGMDGAGGSISWLTNAWKGTGYTLSLGVPMIPTEPNGTPDGTLAQGAAGAYNSYYTTLAQTLVAGGEANAYLRIGWEFDGGWYLWGATTPAAEASYAAYFQQIVTAMRSVPGEAFRFVWNPDSGAFAQAGYNVALGWPGSSYVDVIGLDTYDQTWVTPQTPTNAWNETTQPGLTAAAAFASAQGKPLAIDEWGIDNRTDGHGLGDDPLFVNNFVNWMKTHNVAYESYFSNASGSGTTAITGGGFPNALAAFIADLG
jgi:Glycosyl hydrolase family 26